MKMLVEHVAERTNTQADPGAGVTLPTTPS
jgi:hypothetical protein